MARELPTDAMGAVEARAAKVQMKNIGDWSVQLSKLDVLYTLQYSKMPMENGPFVSDFPNESSVHKGFSIARFDS